MAEIYEDRYNTSESPTRYIKQRVTDEAPALDSDSDSSERGQQYKPAFWTSVVAGGVAGVVVDLSLYPLDTIKTRLQSEKGFRLSGGFRKLYKGVVPVLVCSAPVSALFFCIYNSIINSLRTKNSSLRPYVYLLAASTAELVCSSVRVPLEIIKQRRQTTNKYIFTIINQIIKQEGFLGFYRGFSSTIMREIPFSCIQYPLWEYMIQQLMIYKNGQELTALQTAYCGALAGATAAAMTTPVDVMKTRVMLAEKEKIERFKPHVYYSFAKEILFDRGFLGFFAGVVPRTLWIMMGGFIYFGAYEKAKILCEQKWCFFKKGYEKLHEVSPSYVEGELENIWTTYFCSESENPKKSVETDDARLKQEQNIFDATLLEPEKFRKQS